MLASELLITDFPVLNPEDLLEKAISIYMDYCICHIPVVSKSGLDGILPLDLLTGADKQKPVQDFKDDYINFYAFMDQHGLDVFELMAKNELSALPVLDDNHKYAGVITNEVLMRTLSDYYSFKQVGGIIELRVGIRDYDLSEISRIVESNNTKILVLYLDNDPESTFFKITIKVSTLDLSRIIATFERYNYTIDFTYPTSGQKDELRDRYELLMKMFDL